MSFVPSIFDFSSPAPPPVFPNSLPAPLPDRRGDFRFARPKAEKLVRFKGREKCAGARRRESGSGVAPNGKAAVDRSAARVSLVDQVQDEIAFQFWNGIEPRQEASCEAFQVQAFTSIMTLTAAGRLRWKI